MILQVTTRITHKYLMGKSKHDLACLYLDQMELLEKTRNALRDALDVVEVSANWLRTGVGNEDPSCEDAAKACDECVAYARSLGVRRNCPGKDQTCPCQDGDACHYEGPDAWPLPNLTTTPIATSDVAEPKEGAEG